MRRERNEDSSKPVTGFYTFQENIISWTWLTWRPCKHTLWKYPNSSAGDLKPFLWHLAHVIPRFQEISWGHPAFNIPLIYLFIPPNIKLLQAPQCHNLYWYLSMPAAAPGPPWPAVKDVSSTGTKPVCVHSYELIPCKRARMSCFCMSWFGGL